MKTFRITITTQGRRIQFDGLFSCAIDATLAGMDHLDESDPHGRVKAEPL
jgi:hypothetical protein